MVHKQGPIQWGSKAEYIFRRSWSLKEAFVKARGDGIVFPLNECEFHFDGEDAFATTAKVKVRGALLSGWKFFISSLGTGHWVSVARGPPSDAIDAHGDFKRTFRRPGLSQEEHRGLLEAPSPEFGALSISDLVPEPSRPTHQAAL